MVALICSKTKLSEDLIVNLHELITLESEAAHSFGKVCVSKNLILKKGPGCDKKTTQLKSQPSKAKHEPDHQ